MIAEQDFKKLNYNVVGNLTHFEGELKIKGDTIIAGSFSGTITVLDNAKILIERDAKISAKIFCHDIEVFGQFEGSIQSSGTLIVRSSAQLSGKIEAKKLSIYPGAVLNMEGRTPEEKL